MQKKLGVHMNKHVNNRPPPLLARKVGEWAETRFRLVEVCLRLGNFDVARTHINDIEFRGLDYDENLILEVDAESYLATVLDPDLCGVLENFGFYKFRDVLKFTSEELLAAVPMLGTGRLGRLLVVVEKYFGTNALIERMRPKEAGHANDD